MEVCLDDPDWLKVLCQTMEKCGMTERYTNGAKLKFSALMACFKW
jgi:hypothetical protein